MSTRGVRIGMRRSSSKELIGTGWFDLIINWTGFKIQQAHLWSCLNEAGEAYPESRGKNHSRSWGPELSKNRKAT